MRIAVWARRVAMLGVLVLGLPADAAQHAVAVFAGGCFWSMERAFSGTPGVINLTVGFAGGDVVNPTYDQVVAGGTGHLEAVRVEYDPAQISYDALVQQFWHHVDPFDGSGQFCDKGANYRAAIFADKDQARAAAASLQQIAAQFPQRAVATKILPTATFYPAEEYHQHYFIKNPAHYEAYRIGCGRDRKLAEIWQ
jgi:peptide-methionine (S)-S-oxide reductase